MAIPAMYRSEDGMDPNANVQERIDILRSDRPDWERHSELMMAYAEWRPNGGFAASPELVAELRKLESDRVAR